MIDMDLHLHYLEVKSFAYYFLLFEAQYLWNNSKNPLDSGTVNRITR